jgi:hypothetical protein
VIRVGDCMVITPRWIFFMNRFPVGRGSIC